MNVTVFNFSFKSRKNYSCSAKQKERHSQNASFRPPLPHVTLCHALF